MTEKKKKKKKLKYVTLLWEELPEAVSFYVIPRLLISKEDLRMLKACHNNMINSGSVDTSFADEGMVNQSLIRLSNILMDPDTEWVTDKYREDQAEACGMSREEFDDILGKWHDRKLSTGSPRTLPRSRLYKSGFLM